MTKKPNEFTITEAAQKLRSKEISVRELWDACISEAKKRNKELNAFLEIFSASVQKYGDDKGKQCQKCQIIKNKIHFPILMLTAKGQTEDKIKGLDAGADDYMTKPFSFLEPSQKIRELMMPWRSSAF